MSWRQNWLGVTREKPQIVAFEIEKYSGTDYSLSGVQAIKGSSWTSINAADEFSLSTNAP